MNSKLLLYLLPYLLIIALPGYRFEFPKDHFNHSDFETEWWYYTGNLQSADNHRYGYELTFFRQANDALPVNKTSGTTIWNPDRLFLAHLALSDLTDRKFEHFERLNRPGPGLAGADLAGRKYWNGNWQVRWLNDNGAQELQAVVADFTLRLNLQPSKPFVIHGVDGVSQKGPGRGQASHYVSFTRLESTGTLERNGKTIALNGASWMDHEFFTQTQDQSLRGWDWFAIQLHNNEELMLYRLRLKSGQVSGYSSGTFIDAHGKSTHLNAADFSLTPGAPWTSSASKATYPLTWRIEIPSLSIDLAETTPLKQQELYTPNSISPGYWEGAVDYNGTAHGKPANGRGYLEMTGYVSPLRLGH